MGGGGIYKGLYRGLVDIRRDARSSDYGLSAHLNKWCKGELKFRL